MASKKTTKKKKSKPRKPPAPKSPSWKSHFHAEIIDTVMKPKLQAILARGVTGKTDLINKFIEAHGCVLTMDALNELLRVTHFDHLFTAPATISLTHAPSPIPMPETPVFHVDPSTGDYEPTTKELEEEEQELPEGVVETVLGHPQDEGNEERGIDGALPTVGGGRAPRTSIPTFG